MIKHSETYTAVPPGETIKELIQDLGMSQKEFAKRMGMSEKHICHLLEGDVHVTNETAIKLEMVLRAPASWWLRLEELYQEDLIKIDIENNLLNDLVIAKKYPIQELISKKWLDKHESDNDLVLKIRKFFEITNLKLLADENLIPQTVCNLASPDYIPDYTLSCWLQKAKLDSREIETNPIDFRKISSHAKFLREFTLLDPEKFLTEARNYLAQFGVAVIYLDRLSKLTIDGAAFIASRKITLAVAKGKQYYDEFLMVFFHELGHIVLEHIKAPTEVTPFEENDCEQYVNKLLFPKNTYNEFISNNEFTASSIKEFSNALGIDTGLVVNRLIKDKLVKKNEFNDLRRKMI
ncbi:MAG: HigA family addiction module antidote protein [Acholeplasmatales bacterium]|nr:HigA family addiction module antidote protein [Acholeplasmatales bacterium]